MPVSIAHKYFNKYMGWAQHTGYVTSEVAQAQMEFFPNPARIPESSHTSVHNLFKDWFLFDRKLTRFNLTPLELFNKEKHEKFNEKERSVYNKFAEKNRFGFFKVVDLEPGEWLEIKQMPGDVLYRIFDIAASKFSDKGDYLITRIIPFEDHWAMSSFVSGYKGEESRLLDISFKDATKNLGSKPIRPRDILNLYIPKVNWEKESLPVIKTKLASILQRWGITDITVKQIEKSYQEAHANKSYAFESPVDKEILGRAPSSEDLKEVMEILKAFWNQLLPEQLSESDRKILDKGPVEKTLIGAMMDHVQNKLDPGKYIDPNRFQEEAKKISQEWLSTPQKELKDRTPLELILEERESRGNPQKEVSYSMQYSKLDISLQEKQANDFIEKGMSCMFRGDGKGTQENFEKAYALAKGRPDSFKILGSIATGYVMSGNKEKAMEMLKAALRVNPDYPTARKNLYLLENMTDNEFKEKYKQGFFTNIEFLKKTKKGKLVKEIVKVPQTPT